MSNSSKKVKYGSYVRKVGYMDIRQKIRMPKKVKDRLSGGWRIEPGDVEIFLYHGKKLIEKDFISHAEAEKKAKELQNID